MTAEPATENDLFYVSLGDEQIKRTLPFLNEVLRQFVTICTALLSGTIVFLGDKLISPAFRTPVAIFFLFGLVSAAIGVLPYQLTYTRRCPEEIEEAFERARKWKAGLLWLSFAFLVSGLVLGLVGIVRGV